MGHPGGLSGCALARRLWMLAVREAASSSCLSRDMRHTVIALRIAAGADGRSAGNVAARDVVRTLSTTHHFVLRFASIVTRVVVIAVPRRHNVWMDGRGHLVDRATQLWVRTTGRHVRFEEMPWLEGPIGDATRIGDEWLTRERDRLGARLSEGAGLLASFEALNSASLNVGLIHPTVIDFYEHTTRYRLDAWTQWCPAALPFGWLLSTVFARRLQQLALPLRPLDVAHGMDSRVMAFERDGRQIATAWLRNLRSTGQTVYSGCYGIVELPGSRTPSVKVVFPLPNGSLIVFLRPSTDVHGALVLTSPIAPFGEDGAYLVVTHADGRSAHVRRVPLAERIRVYVDDEEVLRTDHALWLWRVPVMRLHYRLEPRHEVRTRSAGCV
jgi:hypothetical protein